MEQSQRFTAKNLCISKTCVYNLGGINFGYNRKLYQLKPKTLKFMTKKKINNLI